MWIPRWCGYGGTFLRQWPTSSPTPKAWPSVLSQGTTPSSSERSCDWECWTWCLFWLQLTEKQLERERGGERAREGDTKTEEKSRQTVPIPTSHFSTANDHCLLCAYLYFDVSAIHIQQQASGQKHLKTWYDIMLVCGLVLYEPALFIHRKRHL